MHFTRVVVDPHDADHLLVICNDRYGAVSESFDGGNSWSAYDLANLSNIRIHQIILVGDEYNSTYVTSYDGAKVYFRDNTMTDFIDYSSGLNPGARISKVVPFYKNAVLRMATNQGVWEAPLYHQDFVPVAQPMALNLGSGDLTYNPQKEVLFDSYSIVRQDENTKWQWNFSSQPQYVSDANVRNPRVVFGKGGDYDVTLTVTTSAGTHSRTIKDMITIEGGTDEGGTDEGGTDGGETGGGSDEDETGVNNEYIGEVGLVKALIRRGESLEFVTSGIGESALITVHNMKGKLLREVILTQHQDKVYVPADDLPTGVYIYVIKTPTQKFLGQFIIRTER
jgi:hypothetical protein